MKELEILGQIKSRTGAGSQEQKIELLKEGFQSETFKSMLTVALGLDVITHIAAIPVDLPITETHHDFDTITTLLVYNNINNDIRSQANNYVNSFEKREERILMSQILTKSLNIGIGVKMINKAYGSELFSDRSVMLATEEKLGIPVADKWFEDGEQVFEEEKFDGNRMVLLYEDRFLDGELIAKDRQSISGKVNSILKGKGILGMDEDWTYNVFYTGSSSLLFGEGFSVDQITFLTRNFKELDGECLSNIRREFCTLNLELFSQWDRDSLAYSEMRSQLAGLFLNVPSLTHIKQVYSNPVLSLQEAQERFRKYLKDGCEGLILKNAGHRYECTRSKNWIKFKGLNECDMKVVSWYKGKPHTKREAFGGFMVESEDGIVKVEVGIGFKDREIEQFLKAELDSYVGNVMTVLYNMRIVNKERQQSLYLPRFKEFRFDKDEANFEHEIKDR